MLKKLFSFMVTGLFSFIIFDLPTQAADHAGIIVKIQGVVEIYTNPSKNAQGVAPRILYNDEYYTVVPAKLGYKVEAGDVVRTGNDAKARIVYKNGDQFNVGEGTEYRVAVKNLNSGDDKKEKSVITLMRGQLRAIISKEGPRNNMEIKTQNVSMGVRGTDFYVSKKGNMGTSEVSVLRGEVEVKISSNNSNGENKPGEQKKVATTETINVKPGFSAQWQAPIEEKKEETKNNKEQNKEKTTEVVTQEKMPAIVLQKTTQTDLIEIQQSSAIQLKPTQKEEISESVAKEVAVLEQKAVETTMKDIKTHDPELYAQLSKSNITNVAAINSEVVKEVFKEAPKAPVKPGASDLKDSEEDPYKKYFSPE